MIGSILHFKNHASPWGVEDDSTLDGSRGSVGNEVVACIFFGLGKLNTSEVSWIQTYGFWAVEKGVGGRG